MSGWLTVAALVAAYDAWAIWSGNPTLSNQHAATCETYPIPMAIATGYLVTHLWGKWPRKADPFLVFAWGVHRTAQKVKSRSLSLGE